MRMSIAAGHGCHAGHILSFMSAAAPVIMRLLFLNLKESHEDTFSESAIVKIERDFE